RDEPFVCPRGRHVDVDDGHIGGRRRDGRDQLVRRADLRRDVDAGLGEDPCEPLAEDGRVVREGYAHGIAARRCVPQPGALSTCSSPSRACTRSARPRRPDPFDGSAPPTPSSSMSTCTHESSCATRTWTRDACAYLATFVSASETTKYAAASVAGGSR